MVNSTFYPDATIHHTNQKFQIKSDWQGMFQYICTKWIIPLPLSSFVESCRTELGKIRKLLFSILPFYTFFGIYWRPPDVAQWEFLIKTLWRIKRRSFWNQSWCWLKIRINICIFDEWTIIIYKYVKSLIFIQIKMIITL